MKNKDLRESQSCSVFTLDKIYGELLYRVFSLHLNEMKPRKNWWSGRLELQRFKPSAFSTKNIFGEQCLLARHATKEIFFMNKFPGQTMMGFVAPAVSDSSQAKRKWELAIHCWKLLKLLWDNQDIHDQLKRIDVKMIKFYVTLSDYLFIPWDVTLIRFTMLYAIYNLIIF